MDHALVGRRPGKMENVRAVRRKELVHHARGFVGPVRVLRAGNVGSVRLSVLQPARGGRGPAHVNEFITPDFPLKFAEEFWELNVTGKVAGNERGSRL